MKFLVMQIGCIECGVSTYPIKIVAAYEEAVEIAKNHPNTWETEGGEGYVLIIDLEECVRIPWRK